MSEGCPAVLSAAPTVRTSAPFLVAGCSSADPAPDTAAKAQLARACGQVVLPLEEYQAAVDELNVTQRAGQSSGSAATAAGTRDWPQRPTR